MHGFLDSMLKKKETKAISHSSHDVYANIQYLAMNLYQLYDIF